MKLKLAVFSFCLTFLASDLLALAFTDEEKKDSISKTDSSQYIGVWNSENSPKKMKIDIKKGGVCSVSFGNKTLQGTWKADDKGIRITHSKGKMIGKMDKNKNLIIYGHAQTITFKKKPEN